jgi:hypothetical protein
VSSVTSAARQHPELAAIRDVLTWAAREGERRLREGKAVSEIVNTAIVSFKIVSSDNVQGSFATVSFDSIIQGGFVRLWPLPRGNRLTPLVAYIYNLNEPQKLSLRVGIFSEHGGRARAIGLRFESPETGRHAFWHAQFIREYDRAKYPLPTEDWIPDAEPTIPVTAQSPVQLIFAFLVAMYGVGVLQIIKTEFAHLGSRVDEYYKLLRTGTPMSV